MDKEESEQNKKTSSKTRGENRAFPIISLDSCLEVAQVVDQLKGEATSDDVGKSLDKKGGGLRKRIAAAKQWGLITGSGKMQITEIAMDILHPVADHDAEKAKQKAYLQVPIFKNFYEKYGWELPRKDLLANIIMRNGISQKDAKTLANLMYLYKETLSDGSNVLEIEKENDEDNKKRVHTDGPKVFHGIGEFKKAIRGGERLTENLFNLIMVLGALREGISKMDKTEIENKIITVEKLMPDSNLIIGQIEVLKSDVSLLDEETLKKIMPQRIEVLIKTVMHHLEIMM